MLSILTKIFGTSNDRTIKKFQNDIHEINNLEIKFKNLTNKELKHKTFEFRRELEDGKTLDDIACEISVATWRHAACAHATKCCAPTIAKVAPLLVTYTSRQQHASRETLS